MRIAIAQLNQVVGDLEGNAARIFDAAGAAKRSGADLVVTPELSLCGYPPEDLLLRPAFLEACARQLDALATATRDGPTVLVGFPEMAAGMRHNAVGVLRDGSVTTVYRKHILPNYTVFDEQRYFTPGTAPCVFDVAGVRVGIIICEDVWFAVPAQAARDAGAQVLVVPNGSPYHTVAAHPGPGGTSSGGVWQIPMILLLQRTLPQHPLAPAIQAAWHSRRGCVAQTRQEFRDATVDGARKEFGGLVAVNDLSFNFRQRAKSSG